MASGEEVPTAEDADDPTHAPYVLAIGKGELRLTDFGSRGDVAYSTYV